MTHSTLIANAMKRLSSVAAHERWVPQKDDSEDLKALKAKGNKAYNEYFDLGNEIKELINKGIDEGIHKTYEAEYDELTAKQEAASRELSRLWAKIDDIMYPTKPIKFGGRKAKKKR